jgi:hypothetical protein
MIRNEYEVKKRLT